MPLLRSMLGLLARVLAYPLLEASRLGFVTSLHSSPRDIDLLFVVLQVFLPPPSNIASGNGIGLNPEKSITVSA